MFIQRHIVLLVKVGHTLYYLAWNWWSGAALFLCEQRKCLLFFSFVFFSEAKSVSGTWQTLDKCLLTDLLYANHLEKRPKDNRLRAMLKVFAAFGSLFSPFAYRRESPQQRITFFRGAWNPVLILTLVSSSLTESLPKMTMKNLVHFYTSALRTWLKPYLPTYLS